MTKGSVAVPHVIVKLWPGESEQTKARLAERITQSVMDELEASEWATKVYQPDIEAKWDKIYKKPGYTM